MKIYTKKGDAGTTQLIGGTRVEKHHIRIEAYGTLDELMSFLGLLRDYAAEIPAMENDLIKVQNELFNLGSFVALDPEKKYLKNKEKRLNIPDLTEEQIKYLEKRIDEFDRDLPPLTAFILPGGHPAVSVCHIARTVARRAERRLTALHAVSPLNPLYLQYLNRLSDYLFVLARKLSKHFQVREVPWNPQMT